MNQQKRSLQINTGAKKSSSTATPTKHESKAVRPPTTIQCSLHPAKKQKLESEVDRRVKLPLRSDDTTLLRSPAEEGLESSGIIIRKDKIAVQPASDGTIVEERHPVVQRPANQLVPDPVNTHNNSAFGVAGEEKAFVHGRKVKDDSKRSLRSHDGGSRSKSELAQYFPNFDEIINPEAKEKGMFTLRERVWHLAYHCLQKS